MVSRTGGIQTPLSSSDFGWAAGSATQSRGKFMLFEASLRASLAFLVVFWMVSGCVKQVLLNW